MAYPTKPSIQTSYTAVEQALGDGTLPGQELDNDLANLKTSLDALNDFVRGVTRSDGKLANQSVSRETLGPDILIGFEAPETWTTGRSYVPPQTVFFEDAFYICVIAHTSGAVFGTDLAASRWELLVDFGAVLEGSLAALAEFKTRYLGAAAADPTTNLAGGALLDGALYLNTVSSRLKAYNAGTGAWVFVSPTSAEQVNINTVAGIAPNVTSVAGVAASVPTVAGIAASVPTVAGIAPNVTTVAGISANVTTVAGVAPNVTTVAGISAAVSTVAANVADVTNFADVYIGPATSDPALRSDGTALQTGDLYFNTVSGNMRVYNGTAWIGAASAVNGTTRRQSFTATAGQTVFTVTGGYDAGFADVYLNGVKLVNGVDVTVTSGTDVVLTVGAAAGDSVDVVAYGTFVLADVVSTVHTGNVDITGEFIANSYNETFVTLSGTTPAVNCETGNVFALTTSGNTTFTFTNPPATGTAYGFTLKVTAGGTHTLTWPVTVDWAGGTAPDAPASGAVNVYVFFTHDGGTNWYGFLSGGAMA